VSSLVKEIYAAYGPHTGRRRYLKGLRILVSGRLGQERAATASAIEGTLPLSTLDADVDYAMRRATTRSGIVGIKVWLVNDGVPLAAGERA
jgi:ribosomal protein S3